jgi:hypothetical protein
VKQIGVDQADKSRNRGLPSMEVKGIDEDDRWPMVR